MGTHIETWEGLKFDYANMRSEDICIEDIAIALSRIPRFLGHSSGFLSVAQHSINVSKLVSPQHRLTALLHDATEAYLGDLPSPLKSMPQMAGYRELEERLWVLVSMRFDLPLVIPQEVHQADKFALDGEYLALKAHRSFVPKNPSGMNVPFFVSTTMRLWDPEEAFTEFLRQFEIYSNDRATTTVRDLAP